MLVSGFFGGSRLHLPDSFQPYMPQLLPRIAEDCNGHQSIRGVSKLDYDRLLKLTGRLLTRVPCIASLARWAARLSN